MSNTLSLHRIKNVRIFAGEPQEDVLGRRYCVTKVVITDEEDIVMEINCFGKGVDLDDHPTEEDANRWARVQVAPFVEYERPDVG